MHTSYSKTIVNDNYFDFMDEKRYWMLGMYASDGHVGSHGDNISISQSGENGLKTIEYIENELGCENGRKDYETGYQVAHQLHFCSQKIKNIFKDYNIVAQKTYYYELPDNIPDKYLGAYMAGYIDGDGCVTITSNKQGRQYLIVSVVGTKNFIYKIKERIPAKCSMPRKRKNSSVYEIEWAGKNAVELCDWMYNYPNIFRSYKYDKYITGKELYLNSYSYSVEKLKERVFDIFNSKTCVTMSDYMKMFNIKTTDIDYKRIYRWLKEWYDAGIIEDYRVRIKNEK